MYSFPVAVNHYVMMLVMTTPSATFACLSSHLHHAYALLSVSTPVILLCFCPSLWAPLQFTGRAHGQQTNAGPSPSLTDRKQSGRAAARLLRNFSAWSLHNAYSPHLSGSTVLQKKIMYLHEPNNWIRSTHSAWQKLCSFSTKVCDLGLLISQKICETQRN